MEIIGDFMKKLLIVLACVILTVTVYAADAGFSESPTLEWMVWQAPEVVVATGTLTCSLMTNPGVALNAGTTYVYFIPGQSVISVSPFQSITVTSGKYVHAKWQVYYTVSTSSAIGQ